MIDLKFGSPGGVQIEFLSKGASPQTELAQLAVQQKKFQGKLGEVYYLFSEESAQLLVGLGEEELSHNDYRLLGFKIAQKLQAEKESALELSGLELAQEEFMALVEGLYQAQYKFDKYLSKDEDEEAEETLTVNCPELVEEDYQEAVNKLEIVMNAVFTARELVNEPANVIYPESLAEKAQELLQDKVELKILGEAEIAELGMEAFLAVAQGSDKEPRLIVMEYNGNPDSEQKTALVGKGLTYDSGGYCIKPPRGMLTMHCDMAGSATVIATMKAIAELNLKVNVVGLVAACENLISGKAFKTGDIIGSRSGKTIEIQNTDAEGRVTLADAVHYATNDFAVDRVIDLATLTGACVVALGDLYTGAVTNDQEFFTELNEAATACGEPIWQLPNSKEYAKRNKSKVADLSNAGGGPGTITAGQFVGEFVKDGVAWVHLDIAGSAYLDKASGYLPERATGVHVKTLVHYLSQLQ